MFSHKETTRQLDREYRNVAEEGKGTHRYYVTQQRSNNRKLIETLLFFIAMILLIILIFALVDGHSYADQCKIIFKWVMSHTPGKVNSGEVK